MTDDEVQALMPVAAELSVAVADFDDAGVAEVLTGLTVEQLYGLAVLYAAHVDVDQPLAGAGEVKRIRRVAVAGASRALSIPESRILSDARDTATARARAVAMTAAVRAGLTVTAVGRAFGRDHSTVNYNVQRVDGDTVLSAMADSIVDRLSLTVVVAG